MKHLFFLPFVCSLLFGCATPPQPGAGLTSYTDSERSIVFGKEYAAINLHVDFEDGKPSMVDIEARNVAAFEGQRIQAVATVQLQKELKELGLSLSLGATSKLVDLIKGYGF